MTVAGESARNAASSLVVHRVSTLIVMPASTSCCNAQEHSSAPSSASTEKLCMHPLTIRIFDKNMHRSGYAKRTLKARQYAYFLFLRLTHTFALCNKSFTATDYRTKASAMPDATLVSLCNTAIFQYAESSEMADRDVYDDDLAALVRSLISTIIATPAKTLAGCYAKARVAQVTEIEGISASVAEDILNVVNEMGETKSVDGLTLHNAA